ncbi:GNAT family N-acetyltransferase [Paenibacillus psychroresistens]|uniref:GNAT family N-acetyltransferase n=1 Tax=Paenibacillus psychroresistens TaxID=1778678 RepID=A0A6B8RV90_9BACL|nr:GNAT family N-acetyltransferase [Paenibacillus psychroresistens]QGQ99545.1 GNAT family N-acetyltransferase [Paenibacillus psychroresistens]
MFELRGMTIADYEQAIELWKQTDGMVLSDADSEPAIANYLNRNPGMSFVSVIGEKIIGTILCGHDGRRGFIYHVAVDPKYRGQSIGQKLVRSSLDKLLSEGITKCHLMVLEDNEIGNQFWAKAGWQRRSGILLYSKST